MAVNTDITVQEARYKELYTNLRTHFENLLNELRRMKSSNPALKSQIEVIENFLTELDRLLKVQRIVQVDKEKVVEKPVHVPVMVPTKDSVSLRNELSLSLLVEKLIK